VHAEQPVTGSLAPGCVASFSSDGTYAIADDTLTIVFERGQLVQSGCDDPSQDVVVRVPPFPDYDAAPFAIDGSTLVLDGVAFTRRP
jgi:hypothetical protein